MKSDAVQKPIGRAGDDYHPFGLPWLDSCYQQTLLPYGPWDAVRDKINAALAERVSKQLDHPDRCQVLFDLLGPDFVERYFPGQEYDPSRLEPPLMSPEEKKRLQLNAQSWLRNQVNQAAAEVKCQRVHEPPDQGQAGSQHCDEMVDFLQHTHGVFTKGMDRHLYLLENEIKDEARKQRDATRQQREAKQEGEEWQQQWTKQRQLALADAGIRSILKKDAQPPLPPPTASSISTTLSERERQVTANVKGAMHGLKGDPPMFWSLQSNSVGRSVLALLQRDPRRIGSVVGKLHGRQLPGALRTFIWTDVLLKCERDKMKDVNVEKVVRERFGKAVTRGMNNLRIKRATHSPISGLIDNAVIEIYHGTPAMIPFIQDNQHMKQTAKALNVLYTYDGSYEPYLIHWLFPLQLAYQDSVEEVDHVYELAMHLDLLNSGCFPRWPQIFAMADTVMTRLKAEDPELHDHLKHVAQQDVLINPKEFLVHLIHQEKEKAEALLRASPGSEKTRLMSQDLLADPLIFLRKWMGEGFVGVLDTQAALFIWDQMFMQRWNSRPMEDVCLTLLELLRERFMATVNYATMKQVFLNEPCKLYTLDIQRGWVHVQKGGKLEEVPSMNRQKMRTPVPPPTPQPVLQEEPSDVRVLPQTPSLASATRPLDPVGIRNIRVKLVFTPEVMHREKWLSNIMNSNFRLVCTVYFGSVKLRSKHSHMPPVHRGTNTDQYGGQTVRIDFPGEHFMFDDLDPSHYDVEHEMGGYPYAVIRVDYSHQESGDPGRVSAPVTLGWARIKLFQQSLKSPRGERPPWVIMKGDCVYVLHAGGVSDVITGERTPSPRTLETDILGQGSEISAYVYDPRENSTPIPSVKAVRPPSVPEEPVSPPARAVPESRPALEDQHVSISDPFDLYIDGINNLPDNASVVKITGRVIRTGQVSGIPDILALPELTSSSRSPHFSYRLSINQQKRDMDPQGMVLLRVYTRDLDTQELDVIGCCMFPLYDAAQGKLLTGGHERHVHYGMPDLSQGIAALKPTDLDNATKIPGCSIYFRLLPHQDDYVPYPDIPALYYSASGDTYWNVSESRVIDSYKRDRHRMATVKDMIMQLQALMKVQSPDQTNVGLLRWLEDILDHHKIQQPANNFDLSRCVDYRRTIGINVEMLKAYGLPDGLYVQCFLRISPGQTTLAANPDLPDEKLVTNKHDYDSLQKAPQWLDEYKTLHPILDPCTVLVIQVFGLNVVYKPTANHEEPGKITTPKGQEVTELGDDTVLGWAVLPLFDGSCVMFGEHHVPLFKGQPNQEVLDQLTDGLAEEVLQAHTWTPQTKYESAALVLRIWDAHFEKEHHPEEIRRHDFLLEAVGDKAKYEAAEADTSGKKISQFVLDSLEKKDKAEGTSGAIYQKEQAFHQQVLSEKFYSLMESALMTAGYGPL